MKTTRDLNIECLDQITQAMKADDVSQASHARIDKARVIVMTPHQIELLTQGAHAGHYKVMSQVGDGSYYLVNGRCKCPAAARDAQKVCKHKIAVDMVEERHILVEALKARAQRPVPHAHTYTCGHASGLVTCWDGDCVDASDLTCETCRAALATPQSPEEDAVFGTVTTLRCAGCGAVLTNLSDHTACAHKVVAGWQQEQAGTSAPLDYTRDQYEEAPVSAREPLTLPATLPVEQPPLLPEAPASLCLTLVLTGGHKLLYTMRSMQPGTAGDDELLIRLPRLLDQLEELAVKDTPRQGWLSRLFRHLIKVVSE